MTGVDLELAVRGRQPRFPAVWLRDSSRCAECVFPGRHLQGCYADLDGLASTLAVLKRGAES